MIRQQTEIIDLFNNLINSGKCKEIRYEKKLCNKNIAFNVKLLDKKLNAKFYM